MKHWIVTDTHFNHTAKMAEYCDRPADYEQKLFDSMMAIPQEDVLIHLGDICIGNDEEVHEKYIKPLKCKKILVLGNHDPKSDTWYLQHGWDTVCNLLSIHKYGAHILFSHKPQKNCLEVSVNVHGHFHNMTHHDAEFADVYDPNFHKRFAVEWTDYKAIPLELFLTKGYGNHP